MICTTRCAAFLALVSIFMLVCGPATAVVITFDDGDLGGNGWELAPNWDGDVVPGVDDQAVIDGGLTAGTASTVTISALQVGTGGSGGTLNIVGTFNVIDTDLGTSDVQDAILGGGGSAGTVTSTEGAGQTNIDKNLIIGDTGAVGASTWTSGANIVVDGLTTLGKDGDATLTIGNSNSHLNGGLTFGDGTSATLAISTLANTGDLRIWGDITDGAAASTIQVTGGGTARFRGNAPTGRAVDALIVGDSVGFSAGNLRFDVAQLDGSIDPLVVGGNTTFENDAQLTPTLSTIRIDFEPSAISTWNDSSATGMWVSGVDSDWDWSPGGNLAPDGLPSVADTTALNIITTGGIFSGVIATDYDLLQASKDLGWSLSESFGTVTVTYNDPSLLGAALEGNPQDAVISNVGNALGDAVIRDSDLNIANAAGADAADLLVENGASLTIGSGGANQDLILGLGTSSGDVTMTGSSITVNGNLLYGGLDDSLAPEGGAFKLEGGTLTVTGEIITSDQIVADGNTANLDVDGGTLLVTGNIDVRNFRVGKDFDGSYDIDNGQTVTAGNNVFAGNDANGTLTVGNTAASTLTVGGDLTVGDNRTGLLTVDNGSTVTVGSLFEIADNSDSIGTATIRGGSALTVGGNLYMASGGDTTGALTITGAGTTVDIGGNFRISDGNGSMGDAFITDKAVVTLASGKWLRVSEDDDATATLTVDDATVTLLGSGGDLAVGRNGTGTAFFDHGATVTVPDDVLIGEKDKSVGVAIFDNGATMAVNDDVLIAEEVGSSGTMTFDNGSSLSGNNLAVGEEAIGTLTIKGSSTLDFNNDVWVGKDDTGDGTLDIQSGSFTVSKSGKNVEIAGNSTNGSNDNAVGSVIVGLLGGADADALLSIAQHLRVGNGGDGTLLQNSGTVIAGAVSSGGDLVIGNNETTVSKTGVYTMKGGLLTTADDVFVGNNSVGTLTLDGGTIIVGDDLTIAKNAGSAGTLNLNGGTLDLGGGDMGPGDGTAAFNFSGGLLKNVGTYGGDLVQGGGTFAPGGSIGVSNITGSYTLSSGEWLIELDATDAGSADVVNVTGLLTLAVGSAVDFSVLTGPLDDDAYVFASYGSLSGTFGSELNRPVGYLVDYDYLGASQIALVVPEPSSLVLLVCGLLGAAVWGWRRSRRTAA